MPNPLRFLNPPGRFIEISEYLKLDYDLSGRIRNLQQMKFVLYIDGNGTWIACSFVLVLPIASTVVTAHPCTETTGQRHAFTAMFLWTELFIGLSKVLKCKDKNRSIIFNYPSVHNV